jgi:hypothetical protein
VATIARTIRFLRTPRSDAGRTPMSTGPFYALAQGEQVPERRAS